MRKVPSNDHEFIPIIRITVRMAGLIVVLMGVITILLVFDHTLSNKIVFINRSEVSELWKAPDIRTIPNGHLSIHSMLNNSNTDHSNLFLNIRKS